jgi:hypothetical protein
MDISRMETFLPAVCCNRWPQVKPTLDILCVETAVGRTLLLFTVDATKEVTILSTNRISVLSTNQTFIPNTS